jgi:hypothetical protein
VVLAASQCSHNGSQAVTRSEGNKFTATISTYLDLNHSGAGVDSEFCVLSYRPMGVKLGLSY